ncbi:MAG: hypothetical protein PHV33_07370 [Elusimicrobiales bacterium]|nr:hypothetical protein [Elusimicrobiales bacterium]
MTAVLCLTAGPVLGATPAGRTYTQDKCFSVVFPQGWVKKEEGLGLSDAEKKVYGAEFFGPVSGDLAVKIGVYYYAPGNLLYKTPEKFIKLHSQPALGINLDGKVYGKVKNGKAGNYFAKLFERRVFEYLPSNNLHPKKIPVYESFAVVPLKNGFFVLRYYAPMSQAKAGLAAYEAVLASFKPLVR